MLASSPPLWIGRYEIIRRIASGGMATVYLARAVGAGGFQRLVAIKAMHPHIASEPDFVAMFLDEARLAASIRHPNVVPTIDVEDGVDGLFLVMDYVEGASLSHVIKSLKKRGERLPLPIALRIMLDALAGLHAAHELKGPDGRPLNLVHRDVSPPNVLVGVDGIARITDFGVARAEYRLSSTRGGEVKGKLRYMPPEQLHGSPLDRRGDVYAAGVMFFYMLTGEHLFDGESDASVIGAVMRGPTRSPRDINPDIPKAIDEACMRALKPVDQRYASAATFAEALEEAALSAGIAVARSRAVAELAERVSIAIGPLPPPPEISSGRTSGNSIKPVAKSVDDDGGEPDATQARSRIVSSAKLRELPSKRFWARPLVIMSVLGAGLAALAAMLFFGHRSHREADVTAVAAPITPTRVQVEAPGTAVPREHPPDKVATNPSAPTTSGADPAPDQKKARRPISTKARTSPNATAAIPSKPIPPPNGTAYRPDSL